MGFKVAFNVESGSKDAWRGRPWVYLAIGLAITFAVSRWVAHEQQSSLRRMTQTAAVGIVADVTSDLKARGQSLEHLAQRWGTPAVLSDLDWESEARRQIDTFPGFVSLEWVDLLSRAQRTFPAVQNEAEARPNPGLDAKRKAAIEAAKGRHEWTASPSFELPQGGRGFLFCAPVYQGERLNGFIVATLRHRELLDDILQDHARLGYSTTIFEGEDKILDPGDEEEPGPGNWVQSSEIRLPGVTWRVHVQPGPNLLADMNWRWNEHVALLAGIVLSVMFAIVAKQAQASRRLANRIEAANLKLEEEIAERRLKEESLRRSEERFRKVFETGPMGMGLVDRDLRFVRANRALCQMLGYEEEELLQLTISDVTHPDDRRTDVELAKKLLAGQIHSYRKEKRYLTKSKEMVWVNLTTCIVRDVSEEYQYGLGIIEDITERKQMEAALLASRERLSGILEISAEGVVSINENHEITLFNKGAERMFGYAASEVLGKPLEMLIPERYRASHRQRIKEFDDSGVTTLPMAVRDWVTGLKKDGREFPAHGSISKLVLPGEKVFTAILHDISEARRTEEALRQAHDELEQRVHERTQELIRANAALRAEIAERVAAEASLEQLSGRLLNLQDEERRRIARELHDSTAQALAAATISISVVQGDSPPLSAGAKDALASSARLIEECRREIRNLAYLLHPPSLDELGLVVALRSFADGFTRRTGVRVELALPPDFERLPAALELAFFRIVQEALTNIYNYSGSKACTIRLDTGRSEVLLEVADQGRGIPPELLQHAGGVHQLGVGIAGMRARMGQLGGQLEVITGPSGTTVRASLTRKNRHRSRYRRGSRKAYGTTSPQRTA